MHLLIHCEQDGTAVTGQEYLHSARPSDAQRLPRGVHEAHLLRQLHRYQRHTAVSCSTSTAVILECIIIRARRSTARATDLHMYLPMPWQHSDEQCWIPMLVGSHY